MHPRARVSAFRKQADVKVFQWQPMLGAQSIGFVPDTNHTAPG